MPADEPEDDNDDGLRAFVNALVNDDSLPDPRVPSPRKVRRSEALRVVRDFLETSQEAVASMPAVAEALGVRLACLDGCSDCCEQLVMISAPEADVIAEWLSAPGREGLLREFRRRAGKWLAACGGDALQALIAMGEGRIDDSRVSARAVALHHQLCALHDGQRCTAYEVRPFICRQVYVADTSEYCRAREVPHDATMVSSPEHTRFFQAAGRVCRGLQYGMGLSVLFQPLPTAISAALERLAKGEATEA